MLRNATPRLDIIYECPVGMVLREAPHAFDAILVHGLAESGGFDLLSQSPWLQSAFRIIGSEKERHRKRQDTERQAKRDAQYGKQVLTRR